jgi:hypothetical protein
MEYYSAMKKNEIILFVGKWMKLENHVKQSKSGLKGQSLHIFPHMQKENL